MTVLIVILAFVVVALAVFAAGSLLDQRNSRARLIRARLETVQKAAERQPSEELALLRDEMLSQIPAIDSLLRRSALIAALQTTLSQAMLDYRAGNFLVVCFLSAAAMGVIVAVASGNAMFGWAGMALGALIPYS